ncbi:hypothetical protein B0H14DRAFT_3450488 [Mycena olivaceomarginata]|nr:hypothetical protein B0H14DRAFT_3450488 [Mycena olivaceomarginata]
MTTSSLKLKQSQKTKKASEQRRKRRQALQQYAERLRAAHAAQNKSSDRSLADFDYRERKRRQKYIENYGGRSYHQFYYPLLEFFGEGNLAGVTIIDETKHRRSKKFKLEITEEYEDAKRRFQLGKKYLGFSASVTYIPGDPQQKMHFPGPEASKLCAARQSHRLFTSGAGGATTPTLPATSPTSPTSTGHRSTAVPPPPTPADSAVYVPGSESEEEEVPRATHPTHPTRRWVREITPDSGGYCVLPDTERPIILPIDNKAAKKIGIDMDGVKAEVGSGTMRIKREGSTARVKHEGIGADGVKVEAGSGTVRIKRKGGTVRVKRAGGAVGVNRGVEGGVDREGDGTRHEAGATPSKHRRGVSTPVPLFDEDSPPPRSSLRGPPSPPSRVTPSRVVFAAHAAAASNSPSVATAAASHAPTIAAAAVSPAPSVAAAVSRTLAANTDVSRAPSIDAAVSSRTPAVNAAISRSRVPNRAAWVNSSNDAVGPGMGAPASSTTSSSATSLAVPPISPSMSSVSSISASTSSSGAGAWQSLEAGGRLGEGLSSSVSGAASSSRFSSVSTAPSSRSTVATGPFYFNSTQQKFFRNMDMAMASMDQNDVVVIVSSATEMAAAIEKGKKADHGEDVNMEE